MEDSSIRKLTEATAGARGPAVSRLCTDDAHTCTAVLRETSESWKAPSLSGGITTTGINLRGCERSAQDGGSRHLRHNAPSDAGGTNTCVPPSKSAYAHAGQGQRSKQQLPLQEERRVRRR